MGGNNDGCTKNEEKKMCENHFLISKHVVTLKYNRFTTLA